MIGESGGRLGRGLDARGARLRIHALEVVVAPVSISSRKSWAATVIASEMKNGRTKGPA